ncbi:MAG: DNA polymerase III subunit gamma/tau [Vallitaleaceae bacterium]|jgi:DNA polymerase-3 subunit gamma/tau|nr:DNA polymerase III subunit gamma/tau [Vallitaleaceae bacterium]
MSYTALYRKWRPTTFDNVVGQDHIVKTLKNQIKSDRIAHAYLFCGTRGTGKTSTAKILAQAINCTDPKDGSPCHACAICQLIDSSQNMNIIEIDAASNNGVDNIREIREEVRYTPTDGRYKVYIIDEVHMLSIGAFNALLKTLEEPPEHVVFILATTEPHKIPITILSRCQRYDFKRITRAIITAELVKFMANDQVDIEEKAIGYISKVADGSMRDALSILDQCIAFYLGETITYDKVLTVLGAVDTIVFVRLGEALLHNDTKACLDIIEAISDQGRDIDQFVVDVVTHFRNLLIARSVKEVHDVLDLSDEQIVDLKNQAAKFEQSSLMYYIRKFSEIENKLKYVSQKRIILEVELIKLCHPQVDSSNEGLLERMVELEQKLASGISSVAASQQAVALVSEPKEVKKAIYKDALPKDIEEAIGRFAEVIGQMEMILRAALTKTTRAYMGDGSLYIICESDIIKNTLSAAENKVRIVEALEKVHGKTFDLVIMTEKEFNHYAHEKKDTTTGVDEAKAMQSEILAKKINFPIEQI